DFIRSKRGLSEIEAAEQLGITRMISGTLSSTASTLLLRLQVIDIRHDGRLLATPQIPGSGDQLLEMQNDAAFQVMRGLKITITEDERKRIVATRSNALQHYYKLLAKQMGEPAPDVSSPKSGDTQRIPPDVRNFFAPRDAHAAEKGDEPAVRGLLDRYRSALEQKDLEGISRLYVELTPSMRDAFAQYFRDAVGLKVQFSNYDIVIEGGEALATFTRVDTFKDVEDGHDVRLQVQVNSLIAKQG